MPAHDPDHFQHRLEEAQARQDRRIQAAEARLKQRQEDHERKFEERRQQFEARLNDPSVSDATRREVKRLRETVDRELEDIARRARDRKP